MSRVSAINHKQNLVFCLKRCYNVFISLTTKTQEKYCGNKNHTGTDYKISLDGYTINVLEFVSTITKDGSAVSATSIYTGHVIDESRGSTAMIDYVNKETLETKIAFSNVELEVVIAFCLDLIKQWEQRYTVNSPIYKMIDAYNDARIQKIMGEVSYWVYPQDPAYTINRGYCGADFEEIFTKMRNAGWVLI